MLIIVDKTKLKHLFKSKTNRNYMKFVKKIYQQFVFIRNDGF